MRANIVAVVTSVVMIRGVRVGLVRRTSFGASCQEAVESVCTDLPSTDQKRLIVVDAGIATKEQCAAAPEKDALLGRRRINAKLRGVPAPPTDTPGRPPVHGAVLHPGRDTPEVEPEVEITVPGEAGTIRLRRWNTLHSAEFPPTILGAEGQDVRAMYDSRWWPQSGILKRNRRSKVVSTKTVEAWGRER